MRELHEEDRGKCRAELPHRLGNRDRLVAAQAEYSVGDGVGAAAQPVAPYDPLGCATKVLDKDDAKRDRYGPEFADRQWMDPLIRRQHSAERVDVEPAVHVGDIGPGDSEHARQAGEVALRYARKLTVVPGGKIALDLEDLLFNDMIIVENPLGGRGYGLAVFDGSRDRSIRLEQSEFVITKPSRESLITGPGSIGRPGLRRVTPRAVQVDRGQTARSGQGLRCSNTFPFRRAGSD